ncbi:MAG: DUF433 domain-containing protein [Kineosporiaceae bacterium]
MFDRPFDVMLQETRSASAPDREVLKTMANMAVLGTPVMTAREAARQLGMPATTLLHWLEGETRGRRFYPPVLRTDPLGTSDITWGEVVEAQYLRANRAKVSMQRLRPFLENMREAFGVPYPLAHFRPYLDANRDLIVDLQERSDVPDSLLLVVQGRRPGHCLLNEAVRLEFLDRVEFSQASEADDSALRIRPEGRTSPVVLDPDFSSGVATVRGVRTEVLTGLVDSGQEIDDVAFEFGLGADDVRAACAYVWRVRQRAAA